MAANGQRLGGVGRVCQELEALSAALFGCWAAQVRSRKTLACGQSGLRGRPRIRFSADSQMVLAVHAITRAVGRCRCTVGTYGQPVPVHCTSAGR